MALLVILIGIPLGLLTHEARRTGQSLGEYIKRTADKIGSQKPEPFGQSSKTAAAGGRIRFLKKIHRVLKPQGIVLLRYPHTYLLERFLAFFNIDNNVYDIPFHLSDFSPPTIERFLVKTGFSDCKHFLGGFTLPERLLHKVASSLFGIIAKTLFNVSNKTYLMPGVSKNVIAKKIE